MSQDSAHKFAPDRFVKVRLRPGVTRLVMNPKAQGASMAGFRATKAGVKWEHYDEAQDKLTTELVIFDPAAIIGEFRLSLFYGELEEVPSVSARKP